MAVILLSSLRLRALRAGRRPAAPGNAMAWLLHAIGFAGAVLYGFVVSWPASVAGYVLVLSSEVVLAYVSRPFRMPVTARMKFGTFLTAVLAGAAAAFWPGVEHGIILVAGTALILRLARSFAYQRTGAVTPLSLALSGLVVEAFTLSYMQKVSFPFG